jgi:hypothetical protein
VWPGQYRDLHPAHTQRLPNPQVLRIRFHLCEDGPTAKKTLYALWLRGSCFIRWVGEYEGRVTHVKPEEEMRDNAKESFSYFGVV